MKTITTFIYFGFAFALACVTFLPAPKAFGVVPPPDGGYPGGNTAEGQKALFNLTTGSYNTALGFLSLESVNTGSFNTSVGAGTLALNSADGNTATGAGALFLNTTGTLNTASGAFALFSNDIGINNTATGYSALQNNTAGPENTANGVQALYFNTTGTQNTALGAFALKNNIGAGHNTAIGYQALYSNISTDNTAVGAYALQNNTEGGDNIAVGEQAGINLTTGDSNIDIGSEGVAGDAYTIRIGDFQGRTFIAGIHGVNEGGTGILPVYINTDGQLGTSSSSRRFKKEIKAMDNASEAILSLKPVTFEYKNDSTNVPQFGLIAEEVAQVNPALVVRDKNGEIYTVRYDAVNAMLLNEFLKEHKTVQELKSNAAKQEATIVRQQAQIEALTAGLQKVSAELQLNKTAPQAVADRQ